MSDVAQPGVALPAIRRARDFHLYTGDGRRLLDLYLDGGAELLGHRPALLGRELKNVLGRGLLGNLPSVHGARLVRVLHRLLPEHRWFGVAASADAAWRLLHGRVEGMPESPAQAADPLCDAGWRDAPVAWWRPLCEAQPLGGAWLEHGPAALLHRLPFRIGAGPVTVSTRAPGDPGAAHQAAASSVSPLLLSGAAAALGRLARDAPQRLAAAAHWPRQLGAWRRSGIYLVADYPRRLHAGVHAAFLDAGVLLNPCYRGPNILPGSASPGEWRLLRRLFAAHPGA